MRVLPQVRAGGQHEAGLPVPAEPQLLRRDRLRRACESRVLIGFIRCESTAPAKATPAR